MSTDNGNSPAMPQEWEAYAEGISQTGLTKREHFAGLAMQGLLASVRDVEFDYQSEHENLSMVAVASADALLEELADS